MSILEAGSPCPCFDKRAVFIYTGGRQPCPFWRQAVHVHVLKKRHAVLISILEAGSHVHSGGRQSMTSGFRQSMSMFWKKAVSIYIGGRQPCPFWRQAVHVLWVSAVHVYILKNGHWTLDSPYLYWRQATMSILEAGCPWPLDFGSSCPCFEKKAFLIYIGGRQPCSFCRLVVHD